MSINEICFFCKEINARHSLISIIIDRNENQFLEPYEDKTSYTFLGGGVVYLHLSQKRRRGEVLGASHAWR